jgi:hypothetical protein
MSGCCVSREGLSHEQECREPERSGQDEAVVATLSDQSAQANEDQDRGEEPEHPSAQPEA